MSKQTWGWVGVLCGVAIKYLVVGVILLWVVSQIAADLFMMKAGYRGW